MPSSIDVGAPTGLAQLRELDRDGTLLPRLAAAFERTLARQQPGLDAARCQPPDLEALRRAMHVLRSATEQLGAIDLTESCMRLEAGDLSALQAFDAQLAALRAELAMMVAS